jgi:rhodanese-related sulfurtransferase
MQEFLVFLQKSPFNIALFAVAVITGGMLVWPWIMRLGHPGKSVSPLQAVQLINRRDALVIDVREANEYKSGHIGGSRHIPQGQLEGRLKELDRFKAKPVILVCATGNRSGAASALLQKSGFTEAYNLQGGIAAWTQASMPLEK